MADQARVVYTSGQICQRGLELVGISEQRIANWKLESLVDSFVTHFGSHPRVYRKIWLALQDTHNNEARVGPDHLNLDYFLISLYFLKLYPTQSQMVAKFDVCRMTLDNWIWYYLKKIQALKEEKIVWPEGQNLPYFLLSVDGVHCKCFERPTPSLNKDKKYYSHKSNSPALSYEVALSIYQSNIIHINGPFRAGTRDLTIFRNQLQHKIPPGSKAIADNGYHADDLRECIAFQNSHAPKAVRKLMQRARARHETLYTRMKTFKVLAERFRCKHADRDVRHKTCFEAVAVVQQFQMENGFPLFTVDYLE